MRKKFKILSFLAINLISVGVFLFVTSCEKDDPASPEATVIELVSGDDQEATVETELAESIVVMVKDQNDVVFQGAKVLFTTTNGSISVDSATTDSNGKARVNWTLGSTVGDQTLTVTAFKVDGTTPLTGSPIKINATGKELAATSMELISGGDQEGTIEHKLEEPIIIKVKDQLGNAFKGTNVIFTTTEGSASPDTITTNENGQVSVYWTLGTTVGKQTLSATAFKSDGTTPLTGSPIDINAAGEVAGPTSIELISGGDQEAYVNTELSEAIVVMVKDQTGNPFEGTKVFIEANEGIVSPDTATTDSAGKVSTIWTLGSSFGTQTLSITGYQDDGSTLLDGAPLEVSALSLDHPLASWIGNYTVYATSYYSPGDWDEIWDVTSKPNPNNASKLIFTGIAGSTIGLEVIINATEESITIESGQTIGDVYGYGDVAVKYIDENDVIYTDNLTGTANSETGEIIVDDWGHIFDSGGYEGVIWDVFGCIFTKKDNKTGETKIPANKVPIK